MPVKPGLKTRLASLPKVLTTSLWLCSNACDMQTCCQCRLQHDLSDATSGLKQLSKVHNASCTFVSKAMMQSSLSRSRSKLPGKPEFALACCSKSANRRARVGMHHTSIPLQKQGTLLRLRLYRNKNTCRSLCWSTGMNISVADLSTTAAARATVSPARTAHHHLSAAPTPPEGCPSNGATLHDTQCVLSKWRHELPVIALQRHFDVEGKQRCSQTYCSHSSRGIHVPNTCLPATTPRDLDGTPAEHS